MELLKKYFELQQQIYDHFGYVEDWVAIPFDDKTEMYWFVDQNEEGGGKYVYSPEPLTEETVREGKSIYDGRIYTQRFLPKWVYRADDYTMVCADTQTDGNKFLMVFPNAKECKDAAVIKAYREQWGSI